MTMKKLAMTTAVAALLAAPAFAQTTTTTPGTTTAPSAAAPRAGATNQIDGRKLIGESIQNSADNSTIGKIDSVILDQSGKVQQVVVGVGGFLGMGKKDVAIDWSALQVTDNGRKVVMNTTKDQLKAMPEYTWPKEHARGSVWTTTDTTRSRPATTSSGGVGTTGTTTGTDTTAPRR